MSDKTAENGGKETFFFARPDVEVFASPSGEKPTIRGTAAIFNVQSRDLGGFRTRIAPEAFSRVMADADVRLLINHDPNLIMGRTRSGTLKLSVDGRGLHFEGSLPDTPLAAHYLEAIRRGDMDGCSFSCAIDDDGDEWDWGGETPIRTVKSVSALYDVGPVTMPAFPGTSVRSGFALAAARRVESARIEAEARRARRARAMFQVVALIPLGP